MSEQFIISETSLDVAIELLKDEIELIVKGQIYYDDDEYAKDRLLDLRTSRGELLVYRKQFYGR